MSSADHRKILNALIGSAVLAAICGSASTTASAGEATTSADATTSANAVASEDDEAATTATIASSTASSIDSVVVTARRRTEKAQDVPIPIAAISGAELEASGQSRLEELNEHLPSTNIQYNNPRQSSIAVRGLGNNPANDALESSVGVYVDGVYLGRSSMANLELADVNQVELLRGPQGTLFGKNTTAGVLNVTTRLPTFDPDAQIEGSVGDFHYYQVKAAASDGLIGDELAGRISFVKTYRQGFVYDITDGRHLDGVNRSGGRGQLLWKPSENFSLRFIIDDSSESEDGGAGVLYSTGPNGGAKYLAAIALAGANIVVDPNYATTTVNGRQHMTTDNSGYSAQADWKLGGFTLTSISAYRGWFFHPENDADGTNLDAFRNGGQRVRDHQVTQELRLVSPDYGALNYVTGVYWFQQQQNNDSYLQYGANGSAIQFLRLGTVGFANGLVSTRQQLKTESGSVFGQVTFKPAPDWDLTAGVRDTYEQKDTAVEQATSGSTNAAFLAANPTRSIGPLARYDNNVSGLLSAGYKITPDVLLYASVSRGAKSGAIDPRIPAGGLPLSTLYVKPEVANDGELGIKSSLLDHRLTVDANLFWTQVQDYQSTLLVPPSAGVNFVQVLSNIGGVRTRGVETEAEYRPVTGLVLRWAGSYNDARYTDYHGAPCSAEALLAAGNLNPGQNGFTCDLTGQRLVGAPQWILNPGASYAWTMTDSLMSELGADYAWRSWFFGSADDSKYARVPSYGLLNLRWRLERNISGHPLSLTLWSKNVLDKRYVLGGLTTAGPLYNYGETPGDPRSYGLTVSWSL
jgi:iron complex outermembrane recepter protein